METEKRTFERLQGFATGHGQRFEVHTAALIFLRGLNNNLDFRLTTNDKKAGVFDDIVFRYREKDTNFWTSVFIQLKIRDSWLNQNMLTSGSGDFSLPKYFKSYCTFKERSTGQNFVVAGEKSVNNGHFEDSGFVLMTNGKEHENSCQKYLKTYSTMTKGSDDKNSTVNGAHIKNSCFLSTTNAEKDENLSEKYVKSHSTLKKGSEFKDSTVNGAHTENSCFLSTTNAEKDENSSQKCLKTHNILTKGSDGKNSTVNSTQIENSFFILLTNARDHESLSEKVDNLPKAAEFASTNSGCVFNFGNNEVVLKVLNGSSDEIRNEFLKSFFLFCQQKTGDELIELVKRELKLVCSEILDLTKLCDRFLANMAAWCEKRGKAEVLHKDHDVLSSAVDQVKLESSLGRLVKDFKLAVNFEEVILKELRSDLVLARNGRVVCIQTSESSCRLSVTKFLAATRDTTLLLDCEGVIENENLLISKMKKGLFVVCVVDCNLDVFKKCFVVLKNILQTLTDRQNVFLFSNSTTDVIKGFEEQLQVALEVYTDRFLFSELNLESRNMILSKEMFFQGKVMTLGQILGDDMVRDRVLDAQCVVEILGCKDSLIVGNSLDEGIEYFVERQLEVANFIKASIFNEDSLSETVTIIVAKTKGDFLETTVDYLFENLPDTFLKGQKEDFLNSILRLSQFQDSNDEVQISSSLFLGPLEFNKIRLRQKAGTALRICTSRVDEEKVYVLFVSEKSEFKQLSDFHDSKHILSLKDGKLLWIHSSGDINVIREHIDDEEFVRFAPDVRMENDRLVLVCAEPGMGKSTLMAQLARETKENFPEYFVIFISLNDHSKLFAEGKHKDVMAFLEEANKIDSHVNKVLLRYALEVSGNVVLFIDGFDEIAPRYVQESFDLIKNILKTKVSKIWMTSRNSIKNELESCVFKFAAKIVKFDTGKQRDFLKRFWEKRSKLDVSKLDDFIDQLIAKTSRAIQSKGEDLMGIPLQIKMLADIYDSYVTGESEKPNLPEKLDLLSLLEQFADKKCHDFLKNKLKISKHDPNYEALYTISELNFINFHYQAGLALILGENQTKRLGLKSPHVELQKFYDNKSGFIGDFLNKKPRFIHRVFAEYFVAKWMSENFTERWELIVLNLFSVEFSVVRSIFDMILARESNVHTALLNEDLEEVKNLMKREDFNVNAVDKGGRTGLHLAAGFGNSENLEINENRLKILTLFLDTSKKNSKIFEQVDFVLGEPPLRYADITHWWTAIDKLLDHPINTDHLISTRANLYNNQMLETIFNQDLNHLLDYCLKNGLPIEHSSKGNKRLLVRACKKGSLKVATLLVKKNASIYNTEPTLLTLEDNFDEDSGIEIQEEVYTTPLHFATAQGHIDIMKILCQKHNLTLSLNENTHYVNLRDKNGETAMHHAAKNNHPQAINFLKSQGGNLQSCNIHNITPLHWACWYRNPKVVKAILSILDRENRYHAVNACDKDGDSVLHYAAEGGCIDCIEILVKSGGQLSKRNEAGQTPLVTAVHAGSLIVVESIFNLFDSSKEGIDKVDFLNSKDNHGEAAIHVASRNGHTDLVTFLINQGGDLLICDSNNCTALHWAARYKHPDTLKVLLMALEKAGMGDFVNSLDKDGDSVLQCARLGECLETVALVEMASGFAAY